MWVILVLLFSGILCGYLLRIIKGINFLAEKITSAVIFILLFFMGLSVGVNETIMHQFRMLGIRALIIAIFTIAGSVLFGYLVERLLFRNFGHSIKEEIEK